MSSDSEESIKDIVNTEQEEFRLKGADDYPYTFDDLCFDHQKVAKTILAMKDFYKDPKQWEIEVRRQFKLDGENVKNKENPPNHVWKCVKYLSNVKVGTIFTCL